MPSPCTESTQTALVWFCFHDYVEFSALFRIVLGLPEGCSGQGPAGRGGSLQSGDGKVPALGGLGEKVLELRFHLTFPGERDMGFLVP